MSAWGVGSFENDSALDWLAAYAEEREEAFVRSALESIADAADGAFLEETDASSAIAAAEVVASAAGRATVAKLGEDDAALLYAPGFKSSPSLVELAVRVVERVRDDPDCELRQMWEEDDSSEWRAALGELLGRLHGPRPI